MFTRRNFIQTAFAITTTGLLTSRFPVQADEFKTRPHKAILGHVPTEAQMEQWLGWGIEGMEIAGTVTAQQAEQTRKSANKCGFKIHSLMGGGSPDRLEIASILGCDGVLHVPGRIGGLPMPQPWEFQIQFDEKTNRLLSVVEGDNQPYQAYIDEHNKQMELARASIEKLIPVAEKLNIVICLENVWNNMWVQPMFAANFIQSFRSPFVKAYFDIGNHVKYANPAQWFDVLQKDIFKIHLKDFQLNPDGHGGHFAKLMEGSVDWKLMRNKMEQVGYNGWLTVELEGCPLTIEQQAQRMERIVRGQELK